MQNLSNAIKLKSSRFDRFNLLSISMGRMAHLRVGGTVGAKVTIDYPGDMISIVEHCKQYQIVSSILSLQGVRRDSNWDYNILLSTNYRML